MSGDETLKIPGKDAAVIGWFQRCGQVPVVVYDFARLVEEFQKDGMTQDEAVEWGVINIEGAWVGQGTPAVLHTDMEGLQ